MTNAKKLLFFLFAALLTVTATGVRASDYPVKYLGIEQGLSNNAVTSIYKDEHGFVWIATYDGLNRYDGNAVTIYRNVWGDSTSLNNNHVNKITGWGNKIFVGTQRGAMYYSYIDSHFHPVLYTDGNGHIQKISSNVNAIAADKKGGVYIGTDYAGFFVYDDATGHCRQVPLGAANRTYTVQTVTVDAAGNVWLFIRDVGLCRYDKSAGRLMVVNTVIQSANCLTADGHRMWIGTDNGLYSFNQSARRVEHFQPVGVKLTSQNIVDVKCSHPGELWIGTNGGGLNIVDTARHQVRYLVSGKNGDGTLHSNAVSMMFEDNEARTWIATLRGGVNIIDSRRQQFKLIEHDPFNKNSVVNNFIISFCEDEQHNLWIGTDGGGMSYWNRKSNQYTNYIHSDDKASLSSNFVVSIAKDVDNRIWVAMYNGGIDRFDKGSGRFVHYACYNPVNKAEDKNMWKLYLDSRHNLWAGSTSGGLLYLYNRALDKFEAFDKQLSNIHAIYQDHTGTLWAGDYSRLIRIDLVKKHHQYIYVKNAIRSITEDKQNHLWVGTEGGGLLRYDLTTHQLKRFTEADGLPSNSLLNVLIDNTGNLWGSTYNGLTEYNPALGKFKNYYASDGLQSNQFNFNAGVRLSSGELAFGGINGFNIFYPDSIRMPVHQPNLKLTGLHINNQVIEGNTTYTGSQAIVDLHKMVVPYDEATIAIDYTALEYSYPDKISYAYYLEGWDHGWNYVGKLKTAYYTRLNEGEYTLRIKATNTAGNWAVGQQLVLKIVVLPPWYRTWWAWLLYVSALGGLVYWFWLYRIRQTKLKYEVQIANLTMEREKELNEKKLSFFTNVSHEFRTPLTLIINPIKDLLRDKDNKDNAELSTIYRNARRLLGLVDHLLLFRKTESENAPLNLVNLNFCALCKDVYLCFAHQAKIKNITYHFDCVDDQLIIAADREKMEIALFNLISNALKFTPEGGTITIRLYDAGANVHFEVTDSGCGIAEGTGEKLFDKFYQIKDNTSLKTGFGIGLYLVKSFIKSHNGQLAYHNNSGGGTTFTVELPKGTLPAQTQLDDTVAGQHLIEELMSDEVTEQKPVEEEANDLELLISDKQSVLIIDDNTQLRGYIKKIFKENYKIYEAPDGEIGLEMIKKFLPDVVISDIVMNELSGIELCRIIKQDASLSHIPVILLTGDPNPEIKLKGIEVGAVDFVSKPFEKDLLVARVQGILKDRRELQNYFYNEVTLKSNARHISEHHKDFLYKCIGIVENYLVDPEFDMKTIADEMGMSYSSLFKKIKAISGQSVNNFVRFVRLRKAAEIMIHTNCNVNEAAMNAGFNDIKYFREHFIRQFGIKPSEFIKKHRTAFNKTYQMEENIR